MACNLIKIVLYASSIILHAGVETSAGEHLEKLMFSGSMTEEEFFEWLKSKGISDKDCKTLSGKYTSATEYLN